MAALRVTDSTNVADDKTARCTADMDSTDVTDYKRQVVAQGFSPAHVRSPEGPRYTALVRVIPVRR